MADDNIRYLERKFREAPGNVQAGLAYAKSLERAGRKIDAFREDPFTKTS